jgi:hypothetical protein
MATGTKSTSSPKKKPVQKKAGTSSSKQKQLLDELKKLIIKIDETGLKFLIRQAKVLINNQGVLERANKTSKAGSSKATKPRKGGGKDSIEVTEGKDNSYFVLAVNNSRNFFSLEEMRRLVNVCHSADNREDGMNRLFNWLEKERSDVIKNTEIDGSTDPALDTIWSYVVKNYTVK